MWFGSLRFKYPTNHICYEWLSGRKHAAELIINGKKDFDICFDFSLN